MAKSRVAAVICRSYDEETVYNAISNGLAILGGIENFVKPDEKILVKPNFLSPAEEEKVITTNPAVIKTFCRILSENGYKEVKVGDSPGHGSCKSAFDKLNLTENDLFGAKIAEMSSEREVDFPAGKYCRSFHFTQDVTEADAIIGLCKMKTHMLERITGAVKNMYGLICGHRKAAGHVSYPTAVGFAKMLTDIHRATPQRLHIMDGVVAMEGNGPASGSPVTMNMILLSADPVAIDTVFCWLIDLKPELVPTNIQGEFAGIGTCQEDSIEVTLVNEEGGKIVSKAELQRSFGKPDFDVQREGTKMNPLSVLSKISGGSRRPVINAEKCVRCGICVDHCPVDGKAVNFKGGRDNPPEYDYNKCIRCYCCQEMCPQKAISVSGKNRKKA